MTVPTKDRGDLIREHGERLATLTERIDNMKDRIDRPERLIEARSKQRLTWSVAWVGVLAAVVGAIVGGLIPEIFKRFATRQTNSSFSMKTRQTRQGRTASTSDLIFPAPPHQGSRNSGRTSPARSRGFNSPRPPGA